MSIAPARSSSGLAGNSLSTNSLSVELKFTGSTCALLTEGELTGTSVVALEVQIDQLCCTAFDSVVLDLGHLRAIDRVGCNVLSGLYHYVVARGATLRVLGARGQVARALAVTPLVDAGLLQDGLSGSGVAEAVRSEAVLSEASLSARPRPHRAFGSAET